ncbi:MAG: Uma2 family endonuclease [Chloroflexota bacterium]
MAATFRELRTRLTPADIETMLRDGTLDPDIPFELIDGEVVELAPSFDLQSAVGVQISAALVWFARTHGGQVFDASAGFRVGPDLLDLRSPDVSFITAEHARPITGSFPAGAPDLAVEVLSRDQTGAAFARSKVPVYFSSGARLVWLVDPFRREVRVYRSGDARFEVLRGAAELTLEPLAEGFALPVESVFPAPPEA